MSILDGVLVGDFELHSGGRSNVKFDVEAMMKTPIDRHYLSTIVPFPVSPVDWLVGLETGGAILAMLIAEKFNANFAIFRKDKTHTLPYTPHAIMHNARIIIVDDVITTGSSIDAASRMLTAQGYKVHPHPIFMVDRRDRSR